LKRYTPFTANLRTDKRKALRGHHDRPFDSPSLTTMSPTVSF